MSEPELSGKQKMSEPAPSGHPTRTSQSSGHQKMSEPAPSGHPTRTSQSSGHQSVDSAGPHDKSLVEVIPSSVLLFPHSQGTESTQKSLTLRNVSRSCVAYKVKTNNIDAYRVRPPIGILKPGTTLEIGVQLIAEHSCLPNDKLLLVTMEVENEKVSMGDLASLWLTKPQSEQHEYRIRCKYGPGEMKPDALKRVQGELEKVNQKMSGVMLSTDSLKFQQRIMQLILILMVLFVIGLLWLTYSMAVVMRHEPFGGICEHCGSILAALVCS